MVKLLMVLALLLPLKSAVAGATPSPTPTVTMTPVVSTDLYLSVASNDMDFWKEFDARKFSAQFCPSADGTITYVHVLSGSQAMLDRLYYNFDDITEDQWNQARADYAATIKSGSVQLK